MTEPSARTVANVLLGTATAIAAYFVLRNPRLREAAFRLVRVGLTATAPAYLIEEVRAAWDETRPHAA